MRRLPRRSLNKSPSDIYPFADTSLSKHFSRAFRPNIGFAAHICNSSRLQQIIPTSWIDRSIAMSTQSNNSVERPPSDEPPLLGQTNGNPPSPTTSKRLKKHFTKDVTKDWADLILLFCYVITGMLDSCAVFVWGSFVSMQTGNTVYLGLGIIDPHHDIRWVKAIISIAFFCLGSFCFARFHRYFSPARRWVLICSYGFQMLLIIFAAFVVTFGNDRSNRLHWQVLVPLATVAFQSSGQAVTSRALKYNGLTSVVLTSNYCDLFSDPDLWALSNVERNRRLAAPLLLLLGACVGGVFAHSSLALEGALWTAAGLKACVVVAWVFWKSEEDAN